MNAKQKRARLKWTNKEEEKEGMVQPNKMSPETSNWMDLSLQPMTREVSSYLGGGGRQITTNQRKVSLEPDLPRHHLGKTVSRDAQSAVAVAAAEAEVAASGWWTHCVLSLPSSPECAHPDLWGHSAALCVHVWGWSQDFSLWAEFSAVTSEYGWQWTTVNVCLHNKFVCMQT